MNDFNIDPNIVAALVRDAERMRAEALREFLVASWMQTRGMAAAIGRLARSLWHRRKWNLSVPAPHR